MDKATKSLNLRLPKSLHEKLTEIARNEQRSLSSQIVYLLTKAVQADSKGG